MPLQSVTTFLHYQFIKRKKKESMTDTLIGFLIIWLDFSKILHLNYDQPKKNEFILNCNREIVLAFFDEIKCELFFSVISFKSMQMDHQVINFILLSIHNWLNFLLSQLKFLLIYYTENGFK